MNTKNYFKTKIIRNTLVIFSILALPLYLYLSFINHLLFHTVMEFSIMTLGIIGPTVGIMTSFRMKNNIMSKLSPAMFVYTILLFLHLLSYQDMAIFQDISESFSSQIWLSANALLSFGFLITAIDRKGKIEVMFRLGMSSLVACIFFALAFYNVLPNTIENGTITQFARIVQGLIILTYVTSIVLWLSNKKFTSNKDYQKIFIAFVLFLISEVLLINHFTSRSLLITIGLMVRYAGFMIMMYSVFVINMIRPYNELYSSIIDDSNHQRKLKEENMDFIRRLSRSQEIAHVGSWELDLKTGTIWASSEAFRIYGLETNKDNIIDYADIKKIALDSERPRLDLAMKNLIERGIKYNITFTILNKNNEYHHINSVATLYYQDDTPSMVYGVINDITDLKNEQDKLLYASYHDHLTNVYNRRYFLEQRVALNFERFLPVSTYILDINGLKIINDSFGHHVGNQVLRKLAAITKKCIKKENSFVARIGGDEFAIILANTDQAEAEKIMEKIISKTSKEKVGNINLSIAYGLAVKQKINETFDDVLKQAEDDMYLHKISDTQSVRNGIIDALLKTLYEKDSISEEHSRRVSDLAFKLAKAVNLSEKKASDIKVAGILHDIGKITLANRILNKKGKLSDEEFEIIKTHPEKGYKIIHSIGGMDVIANYVVQHHERFDGFGYPLGLSKEDISYEGRIICIADAYDAMTSFRTYKDRMSDSDAVAELIACKGKQFDPDLVDVFINEVLKFKKGSEE